MPGRTLAHYEIVERIGAGGMGVVYRARDTHLDRLVALKVVSERERDDPQSAARLMREARTASALSHPNICTIFEAGVADEATYIAMELIEGRSLDADLSTGRLPAETVVRYGIQIADALAHAHQRGVIHRDLKCANIVIANDGQLKVLDFGLARREPRDLTHSIETVTQAGTVMGTMPYMAPEIFEGRPADARTDLWALGVILYRALAGSLPFPGATAFQIASAVQRDEPPPLPPETLKGVTAIVQRLLAKNPSDRHESAAEVAAALRAIHQGPQRAPRRRWRWVAVLAAALALMAAAGIWMGRPQTLSDGARPSSNRQANEYYERALLFGSSGAKTDPDQWERMLGRALEADPKFAAARASQSWGLLMRIWGGFSNDAALLYTVEEGARRALRDDPDCGGAYFDLAVVHLLQGRKELFTAEANRAAAANPKDERIPTWEVVYHHLNGEYDTAVRQVRGIIARSPLQWPTHLYLGDLLREQGDTAGAIREESRILEVQPGHGAALGSVARAYLDAGDLPKARQTIELADEVIRKTYRIRFPRALLLALEHKREEAFREMDSGMEAYAGAHVFAPLQAAEIYAVLGDSDKALGWMERAVRMGDDREDWFRRDPHLASIRQNPKFEQMLASVAYRRRQRPR